MKKVILSIMAAVMVVLMCVSLTACVNAKGVKGEKVTKEEWTKAFDTLFNAEDADITMKLSSKGTTTYLHKTMIQTTKWSATQTENFTIIQNGNLESVKGKAKLSITGDKLAAEDLLGKAKTEDVELYGETKDGVTYVYEKGLDGEWTKEKTYADSAIEDKFYQLGIATFNYNNYTYSSKHNGYVNKNYKEGDTNVVVLKFKDAQLVAIYIYFEVAELVDKAQEYEKTFAKQEINITITYEAEDITLPTVEEVKEEE